METEGVDVPRYFVCPISLQIMKDPVTIATGITYDRESIERWLFLDKKLTCPLTKQPLSRDLDITPNHTLRRLIQAWCAANASNGVDRIPTPREPLTRPRISKLLHDLSDPALTSDTLRLLASLSTDSESNRRSMVQAGVPNCMISIIIQSYRSNRIQRAEDAIAVLTALKVSRDALKPLAADDYDLIESLTWVLKHARSDTSSNGPRHRGTVFLKTVLSVVNSTVGERLKPDFFLAVISVLNTRSSPQTVKSALKVLLKACPMGTNRSKIAEAGAVKALIELELATPDKRTSELILGLMDHLCSCADGRADLVGHGAGIAVVAKRILRVSPVADDLAVRILSSVCKFSATNEVLQEMLKVGAVSKLCLVLQADCSTAVKEKARRVLRSHSEAWKNSPCIASYLITRYP